MKKHTLFSIVLGLFVSSLLESLELSLLSLSYWILFVLFILLFQYLYSKCK